MIKINIPNNNFEERKYIIVWKIRAEEIPQPGRKTWSKRLGSIMTIRHKVTPLAKV